VLALAVLAILPSSTWADHPTSYKGRFDFTTVDMQPVSATVLLVQGSLAGNETHLGSFTGEVEYYVDLTTFAFAGSLTKTAANGDQLHETVSGQFTPTGSVGEFTITGGTGRSDGATGSGSFVGMWTDPDTTTAHITFDGALSFARGE
jgi:hypothetical protein